MGRDRPHGAARKELRVAQHMEFRTKVVSLTDPAVDPGLYTRCLQLRRDVFISEMGWNLYESMGCEFDQYDTPASIHIVAMTGDDLAGCMRLLRTDNVQGNSTYMILDAHRGQIPNLPAGILRDEIATPTAWEASRLAISRYVPGRQRNEVLIKLVNAGARYIAERGGDTMLGMMNPVFRRVFQRAGLTVEQFGPTASQRDGRLCVLKWDVVQKNAIAA